MTGRFRTLWIPTLACLALWALCVPAVAEILPQGAPVILERDVRFAAGDGSDVLLESGNYFISVREEPPVLVQKEFSDAPILLPGQIGSHQETLSEPVAESISTGEDEHHLVLLLPDGRSLDLKGSYSGVRGRSVEPASATAIASYRSATRAQLRSRSVLEPLPPTVKPRSAPEAPGAISRQVIFKVKDGPELRTLRSRADGEPTSIAFVPEDIDPDERARMERQGLSEVRVRSDVDSVNAILGDRSLVLSWAPVHDRADRFLEAERRTGEAAIGEELSDLSAFFVAATPGDEASRNLVNRLNALESIELAYQPYPTEVAATDRPPPTGDFVSKQGYLEAPDGSGFEGLDARFAWTKPGGKGAGVKVVVLEFGWDRTHEDLPRPFWRDGIHWGHNAASMNHGSASVGVIFGVPNTYGITGIANEARLGFASIYHQASFWERLFDELPERYYSTATAINNAAARLRAGDVITISLQTSPPSSEAPDPSGCPCNCPQYGMLPVESQLNERVAIRNATARGIYVMEAAGNGSVDLDHARYGGRFTPGNSAFVETRAIMVGASDGRLAPACFTNHGRRVNVHAWGSNVMSTGYGSCSDSALNCNPGSGDRRQFYTDTYGGTSSATPITAGAVATIAGARKAAGKSRLTPVEMRTLISSTGTAQSGTKRIGPQTDLCKALARTLPTTCPRASGAGAATTGEDSE